MTDQAELMPCPFCGAAATGLHDWSKSHSPMTAPVVIREWPAAPKDSFREALTEEHNAAIRALRAEVEALTKQLRTAQSIFQTVNSAGLEEMARAERERARAEAAEKALEKFGNHDNGCDHWDDGECDCGWAALEPRK